MDAKTNAAHKAGPFTPRSRERGRDQILRDIVRTLDQITDLLKRPKLDVLHGSPQLSLSLHRIQRCSAHLRSRLVHLPTNGRV